MVTCFTTQFLSLYVGVFRGCTCFLDETKLHCKVCSEPAAAETAAAETAAAAAAAETAAATAAETEAAAAAASSAPSTILNGM